MSASIALVSHLSVRIIDLLGLLHLVGQRLRCRRVLLGLRRREFGRLRAKLDARLCLGLVTSLVEVIPLGAALKVILLLTVAFLLVALLAFLLLALVNLSTLLRLLFVIFLGGDVSILLEFALAEEEVDLHDLVGLGEQPLLVHRDHVVKLLGLCLLGELEEEAQLVGLAALVGDGLPIDLLGAERLQEAHHLVLLFAKVKAVGGVTVAAGVGLAREQVDLEHEGRLLLPDHAREEVGVVRVELPVVRVRIDLILAKLLKWRALSSLEFASAPLAVVAAVVVISVGALLVGPSTVAVVPPTSPLAVPIATVAPAVSRLSALLVAATAIAVTAPVNYLSLVRAARHILAFTKHLGC